MTLSIWRQTTPLIRPRKTHALKLARGRSAARWTSRGEMRSSGHSSRPATAYPQAANTLLTTIVTPNATTPWPVTRTSSTRSVYRTWRDKSTTLIQP